jgi:uncharacterized protein
VELRQDLARRDLALNLFSLTFGGIAALAEIGSGTLFTPYFRAAGMEPKLAIGTSAVIGLPVSLAGAVSYAWEGRNVPLGHWMLGYINVPAFIALVAGTLLTVRLGGCAPAAVASPGRAIFAVPGAERRAHVVFDAELKAAGSKPGLRAMPTP